ncbi:hypothetical protein AJ80_03863 [Polytolypa hystricis UAMH7299]|uniref:Vacuolar membrane-associated protein IML1 n=1 Tax=Polytolypa hystricis (strain UAMH7299) TaxID=1447883 RepID=A0A2B7YF45_POLH7|nr:hypothetical protein AJ80_03863 [Polytolypa hystricis UAMH7299]
MPPRRPAKASHLRQVSAASVDTTSSQSTTISAYPSAQDSIDQNESQRSTAGASRKLCSLWVHDENFSREEVLFNLSAFGDLGVEIGDLIEVSAPGTIPGDSHVPTKKPDSSGRRVRDTTDSEPLRASSPTTSAGPQGRYLFLAKPLPPDVKTRQPNLQISVANNVANIFGFKNRSMVQLSTKAKSQCSASHVELIFRDQYLVRADMWRLAMSELVNKPLYKGQKIIFMGNIKATIKSIYVNGRKTLAGYFSPRTVPVFRSESARYVLFIQMSKEMWDFDSEGSGDILFSRVINGLLPELFKRWANIEARHLVTIVLFTRVQYDMTPANTSANALSNYKTNRMASDSRPPFQDYYRVVVNDMPSGNWTAILNELKREFRIFLRDVSIPQAHFPESPTSAEDIQTRDPNCPAVIAGHPTSALHGNILEAINSATSYLTFEHIGRDLVRTGTSIVLITPGTGIFEVAYETLALTSELLTSRAIGIDLICLSPMPLHSVPLFKYKLPRDSQSRPGSAISKDSTIRQPPSDIGASPDSLSSRFSHSKMLTTPYEPAPRSLQRPSSANNADNWAYGIPQWMDVSFWDPALYKESRAAMAKVLKTPVPATVAKQSKPFVPKVRMYEIQMMGVMESEQSNISVPYLSSSEGRPLKGASAMFSNQHSNDIPNSGRYLSPQGSPLKQHFSDSFRSGSMLLSLKDPKRSIFPGPTKQVTKTLEWMDSYDNTTFRINPRNQDRRKTSKAKRRESDALSLRPKEKQPPPQDGHREPDYPTVRVRHDLSSRPSNNGLRPGLMLPSSSATKPTKPAKKSNMKSPSKLSAPRISRSISFALRGLGPAPPRAVPSTEINVEHAKALPTTSRRGHQSAISESNTVDATSISIPDPPVGPSTGTPKASNFDIAKTPNEGEVTPSRPISIRVAAKKPVEEGSIDSHGLESSFSTSTTEMPYDRRQSMKSHGIFPMKRMGPKFDLAQSASQNELNLPISPTKALSPWIIPVNPHNPPKRGPSKSSWFGRWQHVYPRMPVASTVKWKSLKSPAILPLTTEEFPSKQELASDFLQTPYRVYQNDESDVSETPKTREILLREMVALRLSHGFQIVVGRAVEEASSQFALSSPNIFDTKSMARDGITIFMSLGNIIHRLVCETGGSIEVTRFTRKTLEGLLSDAKSFATNYSPAVKTILSAQYCKNTISLQLPQEEFNWNYADAFLAGHRDHVTDPARQLRFFRTRYVLIPVQLPPNSRRPMSSYTEDNEEEIHLLGINQLTQLWQRYRYIPPEEKRFHTTSQKKDPNPFNIIYQTFNPSEVVAAELDRLLLEDPGLDNPSIQLLPDSELLQRSNINLTSLAQTIQGEKGVRMMDRRWHWRLHYNCFVGIEFTTWLLQNFRDIDTREEAVQFGNELMNHGLFHHVQRRHNFRDGNYFYQISDEYRIPRPESRSSWFPARKPDKSVPNTPMGEGTREHSTGRDRLDKSAGESSSSRAETPTPARSTRSKVSIYLSKSMKYDVDPRKRSNRPEVIDLHYDRLHNPDHCFHIELRWLNATSKLVEDAVVSWATTAEKYGLKLVEMPISEASSIVETQLFRRPYPVKFMIDPPDPPTTNFYSASSFSSQSIADRHYYHKALLKKHDFVLDLEAASAYPPDVDVSYSWGKPDYRYPQYVHRTGSVLAQITDDGYFLFLANRLFSGRGPTPKDSGRFDRNEFFRPRAATLDPLASPHLSPVVRASVESNTSGQYHAEALNVYRMADELKTEVEALCHDQSRLEAFFVEVAAQAKPASTKVSPTTSLAMDSSIPTLELPASVVGRTISPLPILEGPRPSSSIDAVMRIAGRSPNVEALRHHPS